MRQRDYEQKQQNDGDMKFLLEIIWQFNQNSIHLQHQQLELYISNEKEFVKHEPFLVA